MDYGIFWPELMGIILPFDETEKVICKECRSYNRSREKLQRMKDWTIDKRKKRSKKWHWTQWKGNLASGSCGWSSERLRKKKRLKIFCSTWMPTKLWPTNFFYLFLDFSCFVYDNLFSDFWFAMRKRESDESERGERESSTKLAWLPRWCGRKKGKRGESKKEKW